MKNTPHVSLSFSESQLTAATRWMDWELEDLSYCLGASYSHAGKDTILVREVLKPGTGEVSRSRYSVDPSPEFLCRLYDRMQATGANVLMQHHTHPFCSKPSFSGTDDESGLRIKHDLSSVNPKAEVVQVVHGVDNHHASARLLRGEDFEPLRDIEIVGSNGIRSYDAVRQEIRPSVAGVGVPLTEERNARAFGEEGVRLLNNLRVLVIGVGGLGSAMAYLLSRLGVLNITALDCQRIDETNLNRFYFVSKPRNAIGSFKASFVTRAMRRFNRAGRYKAVNASIYDEAAVLVAVKDADLIVMALDSDGPRSVGMSLAARFGKPVVNVSNAIYLDGNKRIKSAYASCQWFIPREPKYPCFRCQGALDEKEIEAHLMSERLKVMRKQAGYIVGTPDSPNAQVIPINSAAAGIAAWEVAMWATGIRPPTAWVHCDLMNNTSETRNGVTDPECTVCGSGPMSCLATGDDDVSSLLRS